MTHDDFNFEPVRGLPEALPKDEYIIWQGSPDARAVARDAFKVRWIAGYFAVLILWRFGVSAADFPVAEALLHTVPLFALGAVACGILYGLAHIQARSAVYTLTNKRVAMRIGAALTMTLNLPYVCIGNASLKPHARGTGTLAFELIGGTRLSYLMTWPHVRPWRMARTQPALRCIPDAQRVAALFAEAAEARVSQPHVEQMRAAPSAVAAE